MNVNKYHAWNSRLFILVLFSSLVISANSKDLYIPTLCTADRSYCVQTDNEALKNNKSISIVCEKNGLNCRYYYRGFGNSSGTEKLQEMTEDKYVTILCDIDNIRCIFFDKRNVKDNENITTVCDMGGLNCRYVDKESVIQKCGRAWGIRYNIYTGHCAYYNN